MEPKPGATELSHCLSMPRLHLLHSDAHSPLVCMLEPEPHTEPALPVHHRAQPAVQQQGMRQVKRAHTTQLCRSLPLLLHREGSDCTAACASKQRQRPYAPHLCSTTATASCTQLPRLELQCSRCSLAWPHLLITTTIPSKLTHWPYTWGLPWGPNLNQHTQLLQHAPSTRCCCCRHPPPATV